MIQLPSAVKAERNEMRNDFRKVAAAHGGLETRTEESQFRVTSARSDTGHVTSGFGAGMQDYSRMELKAFFTNREDAEAMRDEFMSMSHDSHKKPYHANIYVRHGKVFRQN